MQIGCFKKKLLRESPMKQQKTIFLLLFSLIACLLAACSLSPGTASSGSNPAPSAALESSSDPVSVNSPGPFVAVSPAGGISPAVIEPVASAPEPEPSAVVLSLWCTEGASSTELVRCVTLFNADSQDVTVQITAFPDNDALAAALTASSPDLLLCERSFPDRLGLSVSAFEPLGYDVPVLLVNDAALEQACGSSAALNDCSFSELCEFAAAAPSGTPFLAASSFTSVFENCLLSAGSSLSADRSVNLGNPDYISVYNQLAECAYSGNLVTDARDFSSFCAGHIVCMFTSSISLAGQDLAGFTVSPFPQPSGSSDSPVCTATEYGLAVLSDGPAGSEKSDIFCSWLNENSSVSDLALSFGLVPVSPFAASDTLSSALSTVSSGYRFITSDDGRLSGDDREAFDQECRAAFSSF